MTTIRLGPSLVKPSADFSEPVAITSATIAMNKYRYVIGTLLSVLSSLARRQSVKQPNSLKACVSTDWPFEGYSALSIRISLCGKGIWMWSVLNSSTMA